MSSRDAMRETLKQEIGWETSAWQAAVQRFDELAAAKMGLHVTDLQIINVLHYEDGMPAGRIAEAAGLSPAAATAAIDRLEDADYVERHRSETDRRQVHVHLTTRSRKLIASIWGPLVREGMEKLEGYTTKELVFLRDFAKWIRELQERHNLRVQD